MLLVYLTHPLSLVSLSLLNGVCTTVQRWISGVVETRSKVVNDDIGDRLELIVDDTRVSDSILGKISPRLEELRVPVDQLSER